MTKGWSKKGERDAEGDRDETNEAAQNLLGGILGEAHQVLSETRHELVGGALQELELRERLKHVEQCFPGTPQDTGGGSYQGGQLLYEDRYEHEKRQDPQRERDGSGPPRDPDRRGPEAPSRKTRHASVSTCLLHLSSIVGPL